MKKAMKFRELKEMLSNVTTLEEKINFLSEVDYSFLTCDVISFEQWRKLRYNSVICGKNSY